MILEDREYLSKFLKEIYGWGEPRKFTSWDDYYALIKKMKELNLFFDFEKWLLQPEINWIKDGSYGFLDWMMNPNRCQEICNFLKTRGRIYND